MDQRIKKLENEIKALQSDNYDTGHLEKSLNILKKEYQSKLTPWQRVQQARASDRAGSKDYINEIFDDFIEFHGDRYFGDDGAIIGGIAKLNSKPVTIVGVVKGKSTEENLKAHFGMPHPEGYRKALRLMKQAEKFNRPIVTFIDTPGAFPGIGAEQRGQGEAIAQNLMQMMDLKVPSIAIILGEAGSGGALALAVTNQVWMLENAIYCILSPEGFASILYKDASKAADITETIKITSHDMLKFGVVDEIISEAVGFEKQAEHLKKRLISELEKMSKWNYKKIQKQRYERFRKIGEVVHVPHKK